VQHRNAFVISLLGGALAAAAQVAPAVPQEPPPGVQARPEPMLLPQLLALPRGDRQLAIDGTLTDWPELPAVRLDDRRQLSGTANHAWRGPNDLGAQVFLLWDADALYVSCVVKDEWHRALDSKTLQLTEIPVCDSVVLTFDPERDTRGSGEDPGRREDREFWLADESGRQVVQWDRLRGTARVLGGAARCVALHDKEHGITSYEASIPWSEILPPGRTAKTGLVLDVQIVVNDFDESTDSMPQTRVGLTFGCSPVIDPGLLASMMLVGDAAALQGSVPEFPPKPGVATAPAPGPEYWQPLIAELLASPPVVFDGNGAAAECGGVKRLALLEQLDGHCARMPRIDFLELHQRIHRRMNREIGGLSARGLPWFWRRRLEMLSKEAADPVPAGASRLYRLPMGGWLVRSESRDYVVDPAGADVAEYLWGGIGFCVLTQPLDMVRRNDQLLVRMYFARPPRTVLTHIAFHLPLVPMETMELVEPGKTYPSSTGARIEVLGSKLEDGKVPWSCSYRIDTPKGPRLLFVGPNLKPAEVESGGVDLAVASPRNPDLVEVLRKVAPGLVVIDDAFTCQAHPTQPRIALHDIHLLQQELRPLRSVLLAPGESWTVTASGK
jgi:hypothetical protein